MRVKVEAEILLPLPRKQPASPSASWAPCDHLSCCLGQIPEEVLNLLLFHLCFLPTSQPSVPAVGPLPLQGRRAQASSSLCLLTALVILLPGPHDSPHLRPPSNSRPLPVSPSPFPPASDQTRSLPSITPSRGSSSPSELNADSLLGSQRCLSLSLGHPAPVSLALLPSAVLSAPWAADLVLH